MKSGDLEITEDWGRVGVRRRRRRERGGGERGTGEWGWGWALGGGHYGNRVPFWSFKAQKGTDRQPPSGAWESMRSSLLLPYTELLCMGQARWQAQMGFVDI